MISPDGIHYRSQEMIDTSVSGTMIDDTTAAAKQRAEEIEMFWEAEPPHISLKRHRFPEPVVARPPRLKRHKSPKFQARPPESIASKGNKYRNSTLRFGGLAFRNL
jgi:hypothetical protein